MEIRSKFYLAGAKFLQHTPTYEQFRMAGYDSVLHYGLMGQEANTYLLRVCAF